MDTSGDLAAVPRGISTLTAFGLAVEIGDWERFTGAHRSVRTPDWRPSEYSSGQSL